MSTPQNFTSLLDAARGGLSDVDQQLFDLTYAELRRIAGQALRRASGQATLNPTDLVHEAYLKLSNSALDEVQDSEHFYSLFAHAMRQIVIDACRQRLTPRHGGGLIAATLTDGLVSGERPLDELLSKGQALHKLEAVDPELAGLVMLHYFGGMTLVEIAAARGQSERTVRRHWDLARLYMLDGQSVVEGGLPGASPIGA